MKTFFKCHPCGNTSNALVLSNNRTFIFKASDCGRLIARPIVPDGDPNNNVERTCDSCESSSKGVQLEISKQIFCTTSMLAGKYEFGHSPSVEESVPKDFASFAFYFVLIRCKTLRAVIWHTCKLFPSRPRFMNMSDFFSYFYGQSKLYPSTMGLAIVNLRSRFTSTTSDCADRYENIHPVRESHRYSSTQ